VSPRSEDLRVSRIASLTLVNAMIFHQILAQRDRRVPPLGRTVEEPHVTEGLAEAWRVILEDIDYIPIFTLARDIVRELRGTAGIDDALRQLANAAMRITARRAALRHDLMGRIYHRLLADAKYFGAFYTTVPAATLLLKLTLDQQHVSIDWADIGQIRRLRLADLACGTGTLLKATLQTIVDNHVRACTEKQERPDLPGLHRALVEESLWGFDVIPFAIHLAASALALHDPDVPFGDMHLYTLGLGVERVDLPGNIRQIIRLGSLDFLHQPQLGVQADLFGALTGGRMAGGGEQREGVDVPQLDLCVMNPPFTRSVGGNLLFGSAPRAQRKQMQAELRRIVQRRDVPANITAGLGSVFSALGHQLVKKGGHFALVLPRALLSGVAWEQTRLLLGGEYHVRYIIVSHELGRWNFSENTKLSECLIVAKRLGGDGAPGPTKFVNLWTKPATSVEALTLADLVRRAPGARLDADAGMDELRTNGKKFAEVILCAPEQMRAGQWSAGAAFAQTDLCRVAFHLVLGEVYIPGRGRIGRVPLVPLRELGSLGPDVRDIHDGFRPSPTRTAYAAFWGHDTESVQCLAQRPNQFLSALPRAKRDRPLRDANLLWSRAGRLLVAERLRLNTARVVSVLCRQLVLSNSWWPVAVADRDGVDASEIEQALALWLNSTLGLMLLVASRVETEGAWIKLKKPVLGALAVMNPVTLTAAQRRTLTRAYEALSARDLLPLPEIDQDAVRRQIDEAITGALGIADDLTTLRRMIAAEPLVIGARLRS